MDHDVIVEQWLDRCKGFLESILQAPDLHRVASASLAIFAQMRQSRETSSTPRSPWRLSSSSVGTSHPAARRLASPMSTPGP
jgi:hypothetical protein